MTIKSIVITGGGPTGLLSYGALKQLHITGIWNINEITSIYASSIGGFIAFVIVLKMDWNVIDDYFINRPWEDAFSDVKMDILEIIYNKGIDGEEMVKIITEPLLKSSNLSPDITMLELYNYTKIKLCFTVTEINTTVGLNTQLISYITHPDITLNKAIAMTTALPMLFKPVFHEEKCFIDGGILNNFPVDVCLKETGYTQDEIIAFGMKWTERIGAVSESSSFIDYCRLLLNKCQSDLDTSVRQQKIKNTILSNVDDILGLSKWLNVVYDKEMRMHLINRGENDADVFIHSTFIDSTFDQEIVVKCQHPV